MGGLLSALNAGKTSLRTNQKALEIAGNNIANVNTPGYSRQEAVFNSVPSLELNGFFIGQGVNIDNIQRSHDVFLTRQIHDKSATIGEETARSAPLSELERIFSVTENNLATEVDRFFDSWSELSANPSGQTERQMVLQRGELLAGTFHDAVEDLEGARKNMNAGLEAKIVAVNSQLEEVAELNMRISSIEASGMTANSDRDRRDMILEDLSEALGVTYYEEDSKVSVQLPGGMPLVTDTDAMKLEGYLDTGNSLQLRLYTGGSTLDLKLTDFGGEFRGTMSVRDEFIPELLGDLDHLAHGLATAVNAQHQAGTGLNDGNSRDFFGPAPPDPDAVEQDFAKNIFVALSSTDDVAAGSGAAPPALPSASAPGDNTNALELSKLGSSLTAIDGSDSFVGFFSKVTSKVGIETNRNALALGGQEDAMVQLKNLRDSATGVSLEEEMVSLMQYQKGFEASAKFLATVDELMDTLLSLKR